MKQIDQTTDAAQKRIVAAVFAASFALYAITCAPGVVWQDSAVFQMRVAQFDLQSKLGLALAHPLYIVLCKAFTFLPFGNQAHRVNLFSGLCAAGCVAILTDLLLNLTRNRMATLAAVLLLAVSHTFWKHAVLAEVMTLYGLGLAAELWLMERFFARGRPIYLIAAFFVNGLGASNHLLAILHLPAYAVLVGWLAARRQIRWGALAQCAVAYVIGVSPYLALCIQNLLHGRTLGAVIHSALFGESFGSAVLNTSISPGHLLLRTMEYFVLNFPTPLAFAAIVGLWFIPRGGPVIVFAAAVFVVDFVFAFRYPVPDQYVFFLPCYILFALFAGLGLARIGERIPGGWVTCSAMALFSVVVYEVGPGLMQRNHIAAPFRQDVPYRDSFIYFLRPRMNGDDSAERFSREALSEVAPGGLLIADSSINNALAYVRDVEGIRRDVALSLPCDAALADPKVERDSRQGVAPFLQAGAAYSATRTEYGLPAWMAEALDFQPAGIIFRLAPKVGASVNRLGGGR